MATDRIYTVIPKTGDEKPRLVRATHPATALSHVARQAFDVRVATQNDLEAFFKEGITVESIKAEQQQLPT